MFLTSTQAHAAIKLLDKECGRQNTFQNKRSGFRDIKWDYLDYSKARKISANLKRLGIEHKCIRTEQRHGGAHGTLRIKVALDFSLGAARAFNRGTPKKPDKPPISARQRFNRAHRKLTAMTRRLSFGKRGHADALDYCTRMLEDL